MWCLQSTALFWKRPIPSLSTKKSVAVLSLCKKLSLIVDKKSVLSHYSLPERMNKICVFSINVRLNYTSHLSSIEWKASVMPILGCAMKWQERWLDRNERSKITMLEILETFEIITYTIIMQVVEKIHWSKIIIWKRKHWNITRAILPVFKWVKKQYLCGYQANNEAVENAVFAYVWCLFTADVRHADECGLTKSQIDYSQKSR